MRNLVFCLVVFLFVPTVATAQTYGCFVEPFASQCANGKVQCGFNPTQDRQFFGETVGDLCDQLGDMIKGFRACDGAHSTLMGRLEASEANRQEWIVYGKRQAALAKKLRRACGTRCKKVR